MPTKIKSIRLLFIPTQIALLGLVGFVLFRFVPTAHAATTITVTTNSDVTANDGECTLREAIIAANDDAASGAAAGECAAGSGADTIEFNISGTADFTNNSQDGYIIQATSYFPDITETVTIDGYSQPGSQANTAVSPLPFNGTLLIEVDYSNAIGTIFLFRGNDAANSAVRGLSLYGADIGAISTHAPNVEVQGNYIGVDATGLVDKGNCTGLISSNGGGSPDHSGQGALIGGLNPEDRNIISGNSRNDCGFAAGVYPDSDWLIQGNYVGLAADGVTAIPNSAIGGSGGFSIDNCDGVIVGGSQSGATNVIAGNNSHGIAPDGINNLIIQGNYIGTDYTGLALLANGGGGIVLGTSTNAQIGGSGVGEGNVIGGGGIFTNTAQDVTIQGNYIGVGVDGVTSLQDPTHGAPVAFADSTGIFGGTAAGSGNIVANTAEGSDYGIGVNNIGTSKMAIVGNSIYDNFGLGIAFDSSAVGNDSLDADSGPNNRLNYPDNIMYDETGANTDVTYSLDVPAGDYRIEFFSNTTADPSGYGEGETYLGSQNITSTGSGSQNFSHTLTGTSIPNISATATFIDGTQPSGFGYTSTFSAIAEQAPAVSDLSLTKTLLNPQDVAIGAQLQYEFVVTNNGPDDFDLANMANQELGADALLFDVMPPDLAYVSVSDSDVQCSSLGEGSASYLGPALANHSNYELVSCGYATTHVLSDGESFSFIVTAEVKPESELSFTNYAFTSAAAPNDPDAAELEAAFGSGEDFIDYLNDAGGINNLAVAMYQPATIPTIDVPAILPEVGAGMLAVIIASITALAFGSRRRRLNNQL